MSILSGFLKTKKYRKTSDGYKLQSEWTSSETVEMTDGTTLPEAISEINSDIEDVKNYAASINTEVSTLAKALAGYELRVLTESQYNSLSTSEKNDTSIIYFYY